MLEGLLVLSLVVLLVGLGVVRVGRACLDPVRGRGRLRGHGLRARRARRRLLSLEAVPRAAPARPVPRDFWLRPTRYHEQLEAGEWRTVFPWFALGGGGFALIILGSVIVALAVLKA